MREQEWNCCVEADSVICPLKLRVSAGFFVRVLVQGCPGARRTALSALLPARFDAFAGLGVAEIESQAPQASQCPARLPALDTPLWVHNTPMS